MQDCKFPHIIVWGFLFFFSAYPFPSPPPTLSHATLSHTTDSHTALSDTTLSHTIFQAQHCHIEHCHMTRLSHTTFTPLVLSYSCFTTLHLSHVCNRDTTPRFAPSALSSRSSCFVSDFNVTFFEYFLMSFFQSVSKNHADIQTYPVFWPLHARDPLIPQHEVQASCITYVHLPYGTYLLEEVDVWDYPVLWVKLHTSTGAVALIEAGTMKQKHVQK